MSPPEPPTTGRELRPEEHRYGPANPAAWRAWAADLAKTHGRHDCPDCGLPVIWRPIAGHTEDEQLDMFGPQS